MATCTLLKWEPRLQAPLATGRPGVSSAGTGRPHQIWSFSYGPGGWACCLDTRPMGGWASISFFCSGRAGGRRDFVVENRLGVGGRPGTPGPVGGPDHWNNKKEASWLRHHAAFVLVPIRIAFQLRFERQFFILMINVSTR